MRAIVYIRLKAEVLDPQGQAIENALKNLGENNINNIRQGKLIEMDIEAKNKDEAEEKIEKITKSLLANTVIEEYSIEICCVESPPWKTSWTKDSSSSNSMFLF